MTLDGDPHRALKLENMPGQARITFDDEGKVAGLYFLKTGVPVP